MVHVGTEFRRVGPVSHQSRAISLDVVVRQFIVNPVIEWFEDESVRYNIDPAAKMVLGVVRHDLTLRPYLCYENTWLMLLSPICVHCLQTRANHARNKNAPERHKCLFESTYWEELGIPDTGPRI